MLGQRILDQRGKGERWQNYRQVIEFAAKYRLGMANKGLLLMGTTGTGKTTILEVIRDMFSIYWRTSLEVCSAFAVDRDFFESRLMLRHYDDEKRDHFDDKEADMIIDELGFEPESVMVFGTRSFPLAEAIDFRYQEWRKHKIKTCFSTNLGEAEIVSRYSDRIWSRLNEMCEIIVIGGNDRRIQQ